MKKKLGKSKHPHADEAAEKPVPPVPAGEAAAQAEKGVVDDRLLRLQADFENFRKRTLRERDELYRRANEDIMLELLPVLDHIELALKAAAEHQAPSGMLEGFKLVSDQMVSALGKFGLSPIDAEGKAFDPNYHEAISHIPSETVAENMVIEQISRGYMLGGRLLRASRVIVSSGAPQPGPGAAGQG